jgi:H+/Cl- antiporter ClcA
VSDPTKKLDAYAEQEKKAREYGSSRYHPDDVRFYLAIGIIGAVFVLIFQEVNYAMHAGYDHFQAVLDGFGLFDTGIMTLASAISAFYFSERRRGD